MQKKIKLMLGLFAVSFGLAVPVWADDYVPEGEDDVTYSANTFTLDGDNRGGDIQLQFGETLAETLQWDSANGRFALSDTLDLQGNELIDLRIERLPAAPLCDAASEGRLFYHTGDNLTYSCDGVGTWNPLENALNATIEFPLVQARRTTVFNLQTTYTDVELDVTDLENDATALDHDDTLRDRINIGGDGLYQIIYGYTAGGTATGTHEARARVRVNDTTVLPGSQSVNRNSTTSASFLANLNDGDFISLQLQRDATPDDTQDEIFFSIVKLEGIKGDKGDKGDPGSVGAGTDESVFTLDQDNTGGDVSLRYGTANNETITWNSATSDFNISDDLDLAGSQIKQLNLESRTAAPVCDASAIGRIYHNTLDGNTYVCNGATFEQLDTATTGTADLAAVRLRDTSTTDLNAAATDNLVPWNTQDFIDTAVYNHDIVTNNSRIQVLEDGRYHVSGNINVENSVTTNFRYNGRVKFRINNTTTEAMRFQPGYIRQASGQTETSLVFSTILDLTANDYFEVLVDRENTARGAANMISGQSSLSIVQLKGPQGPPGPTGPAGAPGAPGDIEWQGTWVAQNYTVNQAVFYQGSSYVCILDTVANEDPSDPVYWELLAAKGDPGSVGAGTSENVFTLDDDDTGGDVAIQFGTTLGETLTWDDANSQFDLSDNLNLEVSGEVLELGDTTATDIIINFDDGADRQLGWDDSKNAFSTFGEDLESDCGPYGVFWAERGTVSSNASWALGNGQTSWGSVMGCPGRVQRFAATCTGRIGTSLGAEIRINNSSTACNLSIPASVGGVANTTCNIPFAANDIVGVYAQTEVGAWSECVGTFWVKYD